MSYIGREIPIEIDGQIYRLARFDRRMANDFLKWAKTVLPNPMANIAQIIKDMPATVAEKLVLKAYEDSKELLDITSPKVQELFETLQGLGKLICLQFQRNHALNDDQAWELFERALEIYGEEGLTGMIAEATGIMPPDPVAAEQAVYEAKGLIEPQKKSGGR